MKWLFFKHLNLRAAKQFITAKLGYSTSLMSRSFENNYPEYSEESKSLYQEGDKLPKPTKEKINELIKKLWTDIENNLSSLIQHGSDSSVYTGYTGIALVYYLIGKKRNDQQLLKKAESLCEKGIRHLKKKRASFLNGDAGPLAVAAVVYHANGNSHKASSIISDLVGMAPKVISDDSIPDEILYGRTGFLYSLLFVNQNIPGTPVDEEKIRQVVTAILQSGKKGSKYMKASTPLMYEWHEKIYFGAAHGMSGILYLLLCAREYISEDEMKNLIKPTLDWLLKFRFPSYNFQSSMESKSDRLVQWCHGAPGFTHLLVLASKVFEDQMYMDLAIKSSDVVWERGLTRKGYSICHGVAGNAYTFLKLYKTNQDPVHLYRLHCYLDWCSRYPENEEMKPDRPFSLYEGTSGLLYFLEDAQDPTSSVFPGYELL